MINDSVAWDEIASEYYEHIISPISHYTYNPLFEDLKKIRSKSKKEVGDFGCGTGSLLELLSQKFKKVHAMDFSKQMIEASKNNCQHLDNIKYYTQSLIRPFPKKLDCIVTINSIISPNLNDLEKIFKNINNALKKDGDFIAILPSIESIKEEFQRTYKKELKKYKSHDMAQARAKKKLQIHRLDPLLGTYDTDDMKQKYFSKYEIEKYLHNHSFKLKKIDKVIYDKKFSYNYLDKDINNHTPMWDWYIYATKK